MTGRRGSLDPVGDDSADSARPAGFGGREPSKREAPVAVAINMDKLTSRINLLFACSSITRITVLQYFDFNTL